MRFCLVHPSDPWGVKIGGAEVFARGLLRHAPPWVTLSMIGVESATTQHTCGQWQNRQFEGRTIDFLPLLKAPAESDGDASPLSLRFTVALLSSRINWEGCSLLFNRIEPALVRTPGARLRAAVVHNDVQAQIEGPGSDVRWRHIPRMYRRVERHVFHRLDRIFVVHQPTASDYRKRYSQIADRFTFLPTWFEPDLFKPASRPKEAIRLDLEKRHPGLNASDRWVLFCGRLDQQKNPLGLINAFIRVLQTMPELQLLLVGEGLLLDQIKQKISRYPKRILWLGKQPHESLPAYYQAADVFLLASHYEGMPLTVLEALACGLPVAATPAGEIPNIIQPGRHGEISADFSVEALACTLHTALMRLQTYHAEACTHAVASFIPSVIVAHLFQTLQTPGMPVRSNEESSP